MPTPQQCVEFIQSVDPAQEASAWCAEDSSYYVRFRHVHPLITRLRDQGINFDAHVVQRVPNSSPSLTGMSIYRISISYPSEPEPSTPLWEYDATLQVFSREHHRITMQAMEACILPHESQVECLDRMAAEIDADEIPGLLREHEPPEPTPEQQESWLNWNFTNTSSTAGTITLEMMEDAVAAMERPRRRPRVAQRRIGRGLCILRQRSARCPRGCPCRSARRHREQIRG